MASALRSSLQALAESGIDCIVVGDIAAALQGAPLSGFDFSVLVPQIDPAMRVGIIRLVTSVGHGHVYRDILPYSGVVEISNDFSLRVVNLDTLIRLKEEQASLANLAALPTLRATLAEIRRLKSEPTTSE